MFFFHDFKKFISRGNAIDMAVGIVLGASFTKIVDVLVSHVIMPPLGILMGGVDFSTFKIPLKPTVTIDIGLLINAIVNFFIVGLSVFILLKVLHKLSLKRSILAKQPCPECKMDIPADANRCGYCTTLLNQ